MFGRAMQVGEIAGFRIRIDASWLLIAAVVVWSLATGLVPASLPGISPGPAYALAFAAMIGLFASVVAHEIGHSLVARRYGLDVGAITLFVFGGVAELAEEPRDPSSEWRIAIAGPLVSFALAASFWLAGLGLAAIGSPAPLLVLVGYIAFINLILALFNLVPAFPLDGGRILRAAIWARTGDMLGATRVAARAGTVFGVFLIGTGVLGLIGAIGAGGLWQILIGFFIVGASRTTYAQTELHAALRGRTVAAIMTRDPVTADPQMSVAELVEDVMLARNVSFVPVVEQDRAIGYVTALLTRLVPGDEWTTTSVRSLTEPIGPDCAVGPEIPLDDVMARLAASASPKLMVVRDGVLLGVVTFADVQTMLAIREGLTGESGSRQVADGSSARRRSSMAPLAANPNGD